MVTEVNKGYVKYEVGEFPEDWLLKNFNDIFSFHSTSNYSKAEMSSEGSVGCIHYGLIHAIPNTHYDLSDGIKFYVTKEQAKYDYVKDGDVIMVDASEDISGVNKSVEVFGVREGKYISGLHTYLIRDSKSNLADRFRGIILNSTVIKNQMIQLAVGMKVFGVSKTQLINIKIPLPPTLEEQKSIATTLTDVDELITGLKKLISKKKDIKQGAMQQLLTPPHKGGKRLPGFSGEWVEKSLGEVFNFKQGLQCAVKEQFETEKNNRVRFVRIIDLTNNSEPPRYIPKPDISHIIKEDDLFMVRYGSPGLLGFGFAGVIANNLFRLIPRIQVSSEFFFHLLQYRNQDILNLSSTTTMAAISFGPLTNMKLVIPIELEEQQAIAQILSDMDAEITQFETKKEKYQDIKQGMMQELLTGKTRLV